MNAVVRKSGRLTLGLIQMTDKEDYAEQRIGASNDGDGSWDSLAHG